jgi:outer membrane receptor protein involved in Fe transport
MLRFAALGPTLLAAAALSLVLLGRPAGAADADGAAATGATEGTQVAQADQPPSTRPPTDQPGVTRPPTDQPPSVQPSTDQPPSVQPSPTTPGAGAQGAERGFSAPAATVGGGQGARADVGGGGTPSAQVTGGESAVRPSTDVGGLLGNTPGSTGVEVQKRTPVIADPRIRGFHVGQVVTFGDGGYFLPARLDLDTAVSKFDSSLVRDVTIIKGPYSVLYGPGFAFLDVATNDTPRYEHGFEAHELTKFGYNTNGQRLAGLQAFWGGGVDWGFRVSYGILVGNDYEAGNDYRVPSSYNSQPINYALGYDFDPNNKLEFKGLHLDQRNVEFAGLYFDITHLRTDADSLRWTVKEQEYFDRFVTDIWYNRTEAAGDTHQGAKQQFLSSFLTPAFSTDAFGAPVPGLHIRDQSVTDFAEMSRGYRMAMTWGTKDCVQLTVGTDLNYVDQHLLEAVRFEETSGAPVPLFGGLPFGTQQLGIPPSHVVDPGVFTEVVVPVSKDFKVKTGIRGDFEETNSGFRFVNGTIPLFFNSPAGPVSGFDPILFSSMPNNTDLDKTFIMGAAYVSAEYKVVEHWTLLGGFAYAERPPTLTELYATGPFIAVLQQGLDRLYGDPNLAPEQNKQVDLGVKAEYENLRGSVNGFYSWVHDYITYDLNTAGRLAPGSVLSQVVFTNTNEAVLFGGEAYVEVDLTDWLTPFGSFTYVEGRDLTHIDNRRAPNLASSRRTIDQEPLPNIAPPEGRVGFRIHEARRNPRWAVEFFARIVDDQDQVARSLDELPTAGFTTYDVRAFWQVNKALLLTAGVENIGNKFYREHLDPLAGAPTDLLFRQGVNGYFGAQVQF